jgi:hypothetical protein
MNLLGIDIGLHFVRPTTGMCQYTDRNIRLGHTTSDYLSRLNFLSTNGSTLEFNVTAIDAPILQEGFLHYRYRSCEKVFNLGEFSNRCKPGLSHVKGTGQALRRAGCDAAIQFGRHTLGEGSNTPFPKIWGETNLIEAFPNAFLGVSIPDEIYEKMPQLRRGEKFDWLYDCWCDGNINLFQCLFDKVDLADEKVLHACLKNENHDERAALTCMLTAYCVWKGKYVAVGDPVDGYFFLPPWDIWASWEKRDLNNQRIRATNNLNTSVHIWINGQLYDLETELP